jgi:hypothetical protein
MFYVAVVTLAIGLAIEVLVITSISILIGLVTEDGPFELLIQIIAAVICTFNNIRYPYMLKLEPDEFISSKKLAIWVEHYIPLHNLYCVSTNDTLANTIARYESISIIEALRFKTKSDRILFNITFER